ncbi:MAG: hypothetical protein HY821_20535 [Acidobacteria bacterium]|nr:hypothetical protein [Acidobacteriota bacterium]
MRASTCLFLLALTAHAQNSGVDNQSLANAANDPTAPVTTLLFRPAYAPRIPLAGSGGSVFEFNPSMPLKTGKLQHLIKFTIPLVAVSPEPERAVGFGDIQVFDLLAVGSPYGKWGFGGTFVTPTATSSQVGEGKWQAGPALGFISGKMPHLLAGFVAQNPISFAGDKNRASVNGLSITPTLTYNMRNGWFFGHSDFDFTFNWHDSDDRLIPIGLQVGHVFRVGGKGLSLSFEAAYSVRHPTKIAYPKLLLAAEAVIIIPSR